MPKNHTWYGIAAIALVSFGFVLFGFVRAVNFTTSPLKSQAADVSGTDRIPAKDAHVINIFIIGDSIAKGTGDDKFKGIGGYLLESLKSQTPKDIVVENAGIDGLKTADLLQTIKSGRMDTAIETADFIIISIGGNDLREIQSLPDISREAAYQEKRAAYLSGFKEITQMIRALNEESVLIIVGLYDPTARNNANENAAFISEWNNHTQLVIARDYKAVFIPTYDLFKLNINRFISADKLHPNSMGYQTVSHTISRSVEGILRSP